MVRVVSLSSHGVPCGIGDYNEDLKAAFESLGHLYEVTPVDRSGASSAADNNTRIFREFAALAGTYDLAIVQHEFAFYGDTFRESCRRFSRVLSSLRGDVPVALFMHTNFPALVKPSRWKDIENRLARRAVVSEINNNRRLVVFVHGAHAKSSLKKVGIKPDKIIDIAFPTRGPHDGVVGPRVIGPDDTVTLMMFGFIARYKGYETALMAMRVLPERFRLVIVGERHPGAPWEMTLDAIHGFIETGVWMDRPQLRPFPKTITPSERKSLRERVHLGGYVGPQEIERTMTSADILLSPYGPEGPAGSSALSMALSFAKPVIASSIPAFVDIQRRANCIRLIPPNAAFELAATARELAEDHDERVRMSDAAMKFARENNFSSVAQLIMAKTDKRARARPDVT